ncbi:hypothetical protein [Halorubrum lacusprofundi]|jgi:hypothetical protein|nr:hypothetical protein [Halorubrum lacusprofundi]
MRLASPAASESSALALRPGERPAGPRAAGARESLAAIAASDEVGEA